MPSVSGPMQLHPSQVPLAAPISFGSIRFEKPWDSKALYTRQRISHFYLATRIRPVQRTMIWFFFLSLTDSWLFGYHVANLIKVVPDKAAAADGDLRVIDESGEDYLYPATYFASISEPANFFTATINLNKFIVTNSDYRQSPCS